jgi:nucleotide-binding universal stress UspA family protein
MKVVIATDLSDVGLLALDTVGECGPEPFSEVVLIHVIDLDPYTAGGSIPGIREWAQAELTRHAETLLERGFEVSTRVEQGHVATTIDSVALAEDAALVIVTSLGEGAVSSRVFGTTAERLATTGSVPVLIDRVVEQGRTWCRLAGSPFARALVAVDLGEGLHEAITFVASLPGVERIRVLHAAADGNDARTAERQLAVAAARWEGFLPVETAVVPGKPAEVVPADAAEWGATLVCLQPEKRGFERLWRGSTSQRIATATELPVLFIPRTLVDQ